MVIFGGIDLSTGLTNETVLYGSVESAAVTPLTTLILLITDEANLSTTESENKLRMAFNLQSVDVLNIDAISQSLEGNLAAPRVYRTAVLVQNMVAQMTAYLDPPPDQLLATHLDNYRLLAREIVDKAKEDDFLGQEFLAQLLLKAHLVSGSTTDLALSSDVATVNAATNSRLLSLTAQTGIEFLNDVVRVKKVVQSSVVEGIEQLVTRLLSADEFIETHTDAGLEAQIDAIEIGNVAAIEAAVSDVTQSAPQDTTFNFVVRLLRPSVTPVSVFYQTADGTAIAADGACSGAYESQAA